MSPNNLKYFAKDPFSDFYMYNMKTFKKIKYPCFHILFERSSPITLTLQSVLLSKI